MLAGLARLLLRQADNQRIVAAHALPMARDHHRPAGAQHAAQALARLAYSVLRLPLLGKRAEDDAPAAKVAAKRSFSAAAAGADAALESRELEGRRRGRVVAGRHKGGKPRPAVRRCRPGFVGLVQERDHVAMAVLVADAAQQHANQTPAVADRRGQEVVTGAAGKSGL